MIRGVILSAALVLLAAGCTSADDEGAGGSDAKTDGAARTQVNPADGDDFSLSFLAGDQPPSVVVAEVTADSIVAYQSPDDGAVVVTRLENPNEVGGPLVFQLVEAEPDLNAEWFEVLLPIRPNGATGWVRGAEVSLSRNPYRIEIDIARYSLAVYEENEPWLSTTVAIGTGETPTPVGRFYVTELLRPPELNGPYGSFAFGLSGFSETLTNYAGGEGVIGIHGTNEPGSLGTDVSHGCVRMENEIIESLAGVLPLGTPVLIKR